MNLENRTVLITSGSGLSRPRTDGWSERADKPHITFIPVCRYNYLRKEAGGMRYARRRIPYPKAGSSSRQSLERERMQKKKATRTISLFIALRIIYSRKAETP